MHLVDDAWQGLPKRWAVAGLLAANLAPLAGVVWLGWSAGQLLVFYWLESGIIGAANVPKVALAGRSSNGQATGGNSRQPSAGFFVFHYGMFWVVHGTFVALLASMSDGPATAPAHLVGPVMLPAIGPVVGSSTMLLALGAVVVGQAVEFWTDFLRDGQYRRRSPGEQMKRPYGRVIVLHVVIVIGAFPVIAMGSPLPALVLLVGLKLVFDLVGYVRGIDDPTGPASTPAAEREP